MHAQNTINALLSQLNTVMEGKPDQVRDGVACLLAGGHLLIEDVPGVGKTTLAHALARSFGLQFSRVQFTADLMPSDLTGVSIYDRGQEAFVFHPGPVFAQVLLADEINRASPKTQSALLEAMEERQITVAGARLISSARMTLPNSGPGWNFSWLPCSVCWRISAPVMSEGNRSGVNCTRLIRASRCLDSALTVRVLARPGRLSNRT